MSDSLSNKTYFQLDGGERFRAAVSAAARGDTYEMDRLFDTCPEYTYRDLDTNFKAPLVKFLTLTQTHNAELMRLVVGFMTAMHLLSNLDESADSSAAALEKIQDASLSGLRARIRAWDTFCREIGVNPDEARQAFSVSGDGIEAMALRATLEADPELGDSELEAKAEANYLNLLRDTWERANRVRGGRARNGH